MPVFRHRIPICHGTVFALAAALLGLCTISESQAQSSVAPKRYALLVAVNKYEDSKLNQPPLQFPESDAKEIGERLKEGGYEVDFLLGPKATKAAVERKLNAMNQKGNDEGAVVIGLFGHGVEYQGTDEAMFCPYDSSMRLAKVGGQQLYEKPENGGGEMLEPDPESLVGMSAILRGIKLCKAGNKLLLADCCRKSPNAARGRAFGSTVKISELPAKTAALFACSTGEEAQEHPDWKHGAMTRAFLDLLPELSGDGNDVNGITGRMSRNVASMVRDVSDGRTKQTLNPIVNGIVELKLSKAASSTELAEFTNSVGMVMKPIPKGDFLMGSTPAELENYASIDSSFTVSQGDDEQPQHLVTISKPFYMGMTEVTRGQFRKFVDATGYKTEAERDGKGGYGFDVKTNQFEQKPEYTWQNPGFEQTDSHPVVNVSWNDAVAFCAWLSKQEGRQYQLPTESQWEYACRGGEKARSHFWNGNDPETLAAIGNVADGTAKGTFSSWNTIKAKDGFVFTAPVGRFRANGFGLQDMHGNVWEWCVDVYSAYAGTQQTDPKGPKAEEGSLRVRRGGSWNNSPEYCRSANRNGLTPAYRFYYLGFRVSLQSVR